MSIAPIVPGQIWHCQQALRFGPIQLATRMTVVRLQDGSLWVHSPITPEPSLVSELRRLGEVRYVVAPNTSHHLFFLPFLRAHPEARGWVAPGLKAKRPDLSEFPDLAAEAPWNPELVGRFIGGLPIINETVWFHTATGTLILTDLLFSIDPTKPWLARAAAKLLGILDTPAMSRTMKLAVTDRRALAESVAPLLTLPVQRIVLAHDQIIEEQALSHLRRAFDWLR